MSCSLSRSSVILVIVVVVCAGLTVFIFQGFHSTDMISYIAASSLMSQILECVVHKLWHIIEWLGQEISDSEVRIVLNRSTRCQSEGRIRILLGNLLTLWLRCNWDSQIVWLLTLGHVSWPDGLLKPRRSEIDRHINRLIFKGLLLLILEAFVQTGGTRLAHQACFIDACIGVALDRKSLRAAH